MDREQLDIEQMSHIRVGYRTNDSGPECNCNLTLADMKQVCVFIYFCSVLIIGYKIQFSLWLFCTIKYASFDHIPIALCYLEDMAVPTFQAKMARVMVSCLAKVHKYTNLLYTSEDEVTIARSSQTHMEDEIR